MFRWFEVVVKGGRCVAEDELPDRREGKRWDRKWVRLGYKREIVKFELTSNDRGILQFSCPGPFHIRFPVPRPGPLRDQLFAVLDAAEWPDGAVKLVPDVAPPRKAMH